MSVAEHLWGNQIVCPHTTTCLYKPVNLLLLIWLVSLQSIANADSLPLSSKKFEALLQPVDHASVLLLDPQGQSVVSLDADTPLIPASTMKLVLALMVLEHWGAGHHFETPFFLRWRVIPNARLLQQAECKRNLTFSSSRNWHPPEFENPT